MRTCNSPRTSSIGWPNDFAELALVLLLVGVFPASAKPPVRAEGGFQLDVFSESYGGGDLFADLEDFTDLDPDPLDENFRIRTDETLPGAYAGFRWQPDAFRRYIGVRSEVNREDSVTQLEGRWETSLGKGWSGMVEERVRLQAELKEDRSRDLLQTFSAAAEHEAGSVGRVRLSFHQAHSSVAGDSLSRIYDFDTWGGAVRVRREIGEAHAGVGVDVRHRTGSSEYTGNRVKVATTATLSRFSFDGTTYDVGARWVRRAYDGSGVVAPSDHEGDLTVSTSTPVSESWRLIADGRYTALVFDNPDNIYFDYLDGALGLRAGTVVHDLSVEAGVGGEWFRPQGGESRSYSAGEVVAKISYFAGRSIWFDIEESVGVRDYRGDHGTPDPTSLSFTSTDFVYSELSLLLGARYRALTADVFGQYTVENHEVEADDVSYFLLNLRIGARY